MAIGFGARMNASGTGCPINLTLQALYVLSELAHLAQAALIRSAWSLAGLFKLRPTRYALI
jgi:hypothetical protein